MDSHRASPEIVRPICAGTKTGWCADRSQHRRCTIVGPSCPATDWLGQPLRDGHKSSSAGRRGGRLPRGTTIPDPSPGELTGAALLLAALGISATMAHAVARRTGEIVIRMALGAQRWRLLWDVAAEGAQLTLGSVVLGIVIASPLQSVARSLLYGVAAAELVNMVSDHRAVARCCNGGEPGAGPALLVSSDRGLRLTERGGAAKRDATVVPPLNTCGRPGKNIRSATPMSDRFLWRGLQGRRRPAKRDEHERGTRRHDGGGSHQRQP